MPVLNRRFQNLETDENPRQRFEALEVKPEPERTVVSSHGPPGALEPVPHFWPSGETQFAYLYRQLTNLDAAIGGGAGGDVVLENINNTFTTNQFIVMDDVTSTVIPLLIDINNNATGVSYPLRLAHRYMGGVGPVGLGVGISLEVESGTEGVKNSIAAFEAQSTVNTAGAMTGEAGINVVVAGNPERVMTFGHQNIRNLFQPQAAATHALFNLGTGATFTGHASGTYVGIKAAAGWAGDYMAFWRDGQGTADFRIDNDGDVFVRGVQLGGGVSVPLTLTLDDTAGAAIGYPLILQHSHSAGAGANGIAAGIRFDMETASSTVVPFANVQIEAINAAVGNLTNVWRFNGKDNNADVEQFRIGNNYAGVFHAPAAATDRSLFLIGAAAFTGHASGTLYGAAQDAGFGGDMLNLQVGSRPRTLVSGVGVMTQTVHDGATTGPTAALQIEHRIDTAGTPAVGMGVGLEFRADDAGKTLRTFGRIHAEGTDVTAGAVDSDLVLSVSDGGVQTELMRLDASTGDVLVINKLRAQGGLSPGNRVARTTLATPATITGQLEIFDAFTGASLGSLPIYANGSFS